MGILSTSEEQFIGPIAAVLATVASHISSLFRMDPAFDPKLFRDFWMSMDTPLAIVGTSGIPLLVNRRMEQFLQYSEPELQRMHFLEFTHPQDKQINRALFEELIAGKRSSYFISKRWVTKNAGIVHGLLTVTAIKNDDGALVAVSSVVQPIVTSESDSTALSIPAQKRGTTIGLHSMRAQDAPATSVDAPAASSEPVWKGGNSVMGILRELALIRRPIPVVLSLGLLMFFVWLFAGGGIHEVVELIKHFKTP